LLNAITKGAGTTPAFIGSVPAVAGVNVSKKWCGAALVSGACPAGSSLFDGGALVVPGTTNGTAVAAPNAGSATVATFQANPVSSVWKTKAAAVNNCLRPIPYSATTQTGNVTYATP
jgi:hypothetical protein